MPSFLFPLRFGWVFFLLVSFWPWEKDSAETKKTTLETPQDGNLLRTVRVALFYERPEISIGVAGPYEMEKLPGYESVAQGSSLPAVTLRPDGFGIRVGGTSYPVSGIRIRGSLQGVEVDKRSYHNAVHVLKNPKGSLTVVNEIDVEDYLRGVLPGEVNPAWPEEALKAQAVVSRTYAIFKNIENKDFPFALGSDVGDQVYKGKSAEHAATNRAVDRTRGEILTYQSRIFPAFFHSTCGGRTTRADYQWKVEPHPSLKGVECSFCAGSKHYYWKAEFTAEEIQNLLRKKGYPVSGLREIKLQDPDLSGRPRFVVAEGQKDSQRIPANDFRLALGWKRIRSTRLKIEKSRDRFLFEGRGWGHGVGFCQFGAKRLAELGYKYRDILRFYYPDSEIRNLNDLLGTAAMTPPEEEGGGITGWFKKLKNYIEEY